MKLLRQIGAVLVGYAVFAVSAGLLFNVSGHNPHAPASVGFMIFSTLYGMLFAALGGIIAMKLSTRHAAAFVGILIGIGASVSLLLSPAADAKWSQIAAILCMAPSAVLGAALLRKKR